MAYLPRAERRDTIVAAAAAVVRRDGLGAVTARVVADELGGSPGQIHHHFASTDELVAEAWRRYADVEIGAFEEAARGRSARAALELFFEGLLGPGGDGQALARWAEAGAHAQLRPAVARAYVETLGLLTDVLADVLGDRGDRGDARRREAAGRLLMVGVGLAGLTRVGGERVVPPAAVMRSAIDAETARAD
ncbi:TetR family transcriptional regulator [Cellulosimicrobium cellulans]|uniref:TetR family transcriptional regulator n=1 Tax=Cellulosimicrobium cellulans TaxID=1710 RepID=UPI001D16D54D|nr:TetR/AcrR family transcriptional regulator [Cellulosimicrobium cellulans]